MHIIIHKVKGDRLIVDVNILLEQAKNEMKNLKNNELVTLKDLFKGYEWKRITQGDKSKLGILFLNYAQQDEKISVAKVGNSWQYKKIL